MTGPMSLEHSNPRNQKKPGSRPSAAAGCQVGCKTQLESDLTSVPDFHVMPLAAALSAEWPDSPQHNGDAIYNRAADDPSVTQSLFTITEKAPTRYYHKRQAAL